LKPDNGNDAQDPYTDTKYSTPVAENAGILFLEPYNNINILTKKAYSSAANSWNYRQACVLTVKLKMIPHVHETHALTQVRREGAQHAQIEKLARDVELVHVVADKADD
jgi:hypothetical protein